MEKALTPIKAIRAKCIDCMCDQVTEVKNCPIQTCPLYDFRLGHNPNIGKRELTDEQREAMRERLRNARAKKQ